MNCTKCKTELVEKAKYCHSCGAFAENKLSFLSGNKGRKKRLIEALIEKVEELNEKVEELSKVKNTIQPLNPIQPYVYPWSTPPIVRTNSGTASQMTNYPLVTYTASENLLVCSNGAGSVAN